MKIDYKITTWERFEIDDDCKEELETFLKENPQADAMDIYNWACDNGIDVEIEKIDGVDETLVPAENNGQATMEIFFGEKIIFSNGKNVD